MHDLLFVYLCIYGIDFFVTIFALSSSAAAVVNLIYIFFNHDMPCHGVLAGVLGIKTSTTHNSHEGLSQRGRDGWDE